MIARYQVLRRRIETEQEQIHRAATKAQRAHEASKRGSADESFYLDSTALNLHGFYNGVERLLEIIARDVDDTIPTGHNWHRDLLQQMLLDIQGVRPAVLAPTTVDLLGDYLGFRHIVRNLYTWDFIPTRLGELVADLPKTVAALDQDVSKFKAFLDSARQADENIG